MTGTRASSKAARTLAMSDDEDAKSAAGSALAQAGSPQGATSAEVASTAGKVLSDPESSARAKSAAGSALAQRTPSEGDEDDEDDEDDAADT